MKKIFLTLVIGLTASSLFMTSCKEETKVVETPTPSAKDSTIYGDLGGATLVADPKNSGQMIETGRLNLRSVVDSAVLIIAGDAQLNPYFETLLGELTSKPAITTGLTDLSENLTDFFCVATGAKNAAYAYAGLDMAKSHNPEINRRTAKSVTDADFTKFVNVVVAAAGKNGVPATAPVIARIGALLETLRPVIVQTPTIYEKLGGTKMVNDPKNSGTKIEQGRLTLRSVVDSTVFVIAADSKLNGYFEKLLSEVGAGNVKGFNDLSESLTDFLCGATGSKNSNYKYTGLDMKAAHDRATNNRMGKASNDPNFNKADNAAYDAFIADVVKGAGKNGVPANAPIIAEIGALLETLRSTVVQR